MSHVLRDVPAAKVMSGRMGKPARRKPDGLPERGSKRILLYLSFTGSKGGCGFLLYIPKGRPRACHKRNNSIHAAAIHKVSRPAGRNKEAKPASGT